MSFPSIPSSSVSGSDAIHTNNTNWETSEGKIRAARSALRFDSSKTQGLGALLDSEKPWADTAMPLSTFPRNRTSSFCSERSLPHAFHDRSKLL